MPTLKITPDQNCEFCHGYGEVSDSVDWGSTTTSMVSLCDCVAEQIPEHNNDIDIEIIYPEQQESKRDNQQESVYQKWAHLWEDE